MKQLWQTILFIGPILLPFVAMPLLWRRMKRVRSKVYQDSDAGPTHPNWQETVDTQGSVINARTYQPNEELIELGDRARHSHWPISNP